jgi:hypothetical protein
VPRGKVIRPAPAKKARAKSAPKPIVTAPVKTASPRRELKVRPVASPRIAGPVSVLERLVYQLRQDAVAGKRPETTAVELKRGLRAVLGLMDIYPDAPVLEP